MNISELRQLIGDVEQRVTRSSQSSGDFLRQLRERLAIIQYRLVQQNAEVEVKQREIEDLTQENTELRKLLNRLLNVIDSDAVADLDSGLKEFEGQIDELVELAGDAPPPAGNADPPTNPSVAEDAGAPKPEAPAANDPDIYWAEDFLRRARERPSH